MWPQYETLAREYFVPVERALLRYTLCVPYTILVMACFRDGTAPV
jgi:hypothetical protein